MKKVLISLIFLFLLTTNVKAMSMAPTGTSKGGRGSDIEIYLTLNRTSSEKEVSGIDGVLSYDNNVLTLKSQSNLLATSNWTELSPVSNGELFSYANLSLNNLIKDTSKNIVKLTFTINANAAYGNTNLVVSNLNATDINGDSIAITGGTHTLSILSSINTLSSLKIDGTSVSNFNSNTTTYSKTVSTTTTSINIEATKTDERATITGDIGKKTLNYGLNTFNIIVTSEIGTTKTYTLNITREAPKSSINTLKSLSLSSGTINFNSNTTTYNLTVNNSISKITITSSLTDSKSTYVSGYGNREVSLVTGLNKVLIKVQAENGSINTYTLNITREAPKSSINTLKSLSLSSGTINFNSNTTTYNVTVKEDIEKVTITSSLTDSKSKYVSGYGNREVTLNKGLNKVLIKVQAENGSINTYTLNITREDNRSKVNTLKSLSLSSGTINFNSNTTTYNVTVKEDIEKVTITSSLTDSKSKYVSGYGNREVTLNKGLNKVLIKVQAENGSINTYTLNITREDNRSKVNTLKSLSLSSGTINFNSNTTTYNVTVKEEVEKVKITSSLTDSKSTYVSGYGNREVTLNKGLNKVLIKVQAENESINTYTLNITRGETTKELGLIKELKIKNHEINFQNDIYEYDIEIDNEDKLNIEVVLEDEKATYKILNNENLKEGSIITIKVVSSDKSITKEYKLNIKKEDKNGIVDDNKTENNNNQNDQKEDKKSYIPYIIFGVGLTLFIISFVSYEKKMKSI